MLTVMALASPDDTALLERISRGNREAFSLLYDRYSRIVFGIALQLLGDRETAEEVTQDVFTSVWRNVRSYRADRSKVATWISRIARNRAIDELRRRGVRREAQRAAWENSPEADRARRDNPVRSAELAMERQRVHAALASLPAAQRQALALAFFRGYSHGDIARALGQPLGTVKTRIRLGMRKLKETLLPEGEEPGR